MTTAPTTEAPLLTVTPYGRNTAASPLRYPGGKAALARLFGQIIDRLGLTSPKYVEPFAGGAGAGIVLLQRDQIDELVINDVDPAVHAFWRSVADNADELASLIAETPLTVEEWRAQKETYRNADPSDPLTLGFAFFYLNRTNRSGILNAGPIGGMKQTGNYKIDARFNREKLAERIRAIGELSDRITVLRNDGVAVTRKYATDPSAFLYVDPPYVDMGGSLYMNSFTHRDHADLATALDDAPESSWLLTYDPSDFIRYLYRRHDIREYQLSYSAHRAGKANELMIASKPVAKTLETHEP